jgi:hypothetical protein
MGRPGLIREHVGKREHLGCKPLPKRLMRSAQTFSGCQISGAITRSGAPTSFPARLDSSSPQQSRPGLR